MAARLSPSLTKRSAAILTSDGETIVGVVHRPAERREARRPGIVLYHDLLGSKDQPHRLPVKLAERLAVAGAVALRIDFRGRGESDGDSVDITPRRDLNDAFAALYHLAAQPDVNPGRLAIVGHCWGGIIGAIVAGRDRRVKATVLLSCLPTVPDWTPALREVDGQAVADRDGQLIGTAFFAELPDLAPFQELQRTRGSVLMVYGALDPAITPERLAAVRAELRAAHVPHDTVVIAEADPSFTRHEWEQAAIGHTVSWLRETL